MLVTQFRNLRKHNTQKRTNDGNSLYNFGRKIRGYKDEGMHRKTRKVK